MLFTLLIGSDRMFFLEIFILGGVLAMVGFSRNTTVDHAFWTACGVALIRLKQRGNTELVATGLGRAD